MRGEIIRILIMKQIKKRRLCSVLLYSTLLSCSTASCVLYNKTEHSRGVFIFSSLYFLSNYICTRDYDLDHSLLICTVCLTGPGTISIHAKRLQISEALKKIYESI